MLRFVIVKLRLWLPYPAAFTFGNINIDLLFVMTSFVNFAILFMIEKRRDNREFRGLKKNNQIFIIKYILLSFNYIEKISVNLTKFNDSNKNTSFKI